MATGKDGFIYCSWLDLRNERTQIFGASSSDGGQTWSENRQVYASPSGTVCECCHPSVAIDSAGAIYIMWRNVIAGNRDMFMAVSDDRGQTFTPARKLGVGSWKLNACPMDGGFLAVADEGQFSTVWRRDQQVFRVDDHRHSKLFVEQRLGSGEQPWVAATSKGMMVVWLSRRGGELWLSRSATHAPEKLADQASDPVIAATCTGNGPIVVAWETGTQPNTSILTTILFDETE